MNHYKKLDEEDTLDVMKFLQEDSEEEEEEIDEDNTSEISDFENLEYGSLDLVQIQEDNERREVYKSGDKTQEDTSGSKQELEDTKVLFESTSSTSQSVNVHESRKRFKLARRFFSNIRRKCSGLLKDK